MLMLSQQPLVKARASLETAAAQHLATAPLHYSHVKQETVALLAFAAFLPAIVSGAFTNLRNNIAQLLRRGARANL
jgi:hypothetical protein